MNAKRRAAATPKKIRTVPATSHSRKKPWPADEVLREARHRTRLLKDKTMRDTQLMLDKLCTEAGWTPRKFMDALLRDVVARNRQA